MPYYWSRVWEIYTTALVVGDNTPGTIINDLAWLFLEQGDTHPSLYDDYNAGNYREPCSNEQCELKTWYNDIMSSGNYQCIDLLQVLFESNTRILTESEASFILHMAPCCVINKFMNTMAEEFTSVEQDYLDYEIETFDRDERQSPYNSSQEDSSDDEMPELDGYSDEETDEMSPLEYYSDGEIPELDDNLEGDSTPEVEDDSIVSAETVSTWVESDYSTDYTTDDSTDYESDNEPYQQVNRPSVRV
jgi:hypothetical protein